MKYFFFASAKKKVGKERDKLGYIKPVYIFVTICGEKRERDKIGSKNLYNYSNFYSIEMMHFCS